jgi:SOS-response transcriptional repressor LexA
MPRVYWFSNLITSGYPLLDVRIIKKIMNTEFGTRLKQARQHARLTQKQLATLVGVSQGTLSELEKIGYGSAYSYQIAMHCGVEPIWLTEGVGEMISSLNSTIKAAEKLYSPYAADHVHTAQQPRADYNVTPIDLQARIPVISWVQAGAFCDMADANYENDAEEWINSPTKAGGRVFALKVRGLSMHNPAGKPSFSEGDIIYCDPDRQAEHKSLVICRLDDQKEATFKRLLIEGDSKMLEALNPSWPERIIKINGNATICGVVFGRYDSF